MMKLNLFLSLALLFCVCQSKLVYVRRTAYGSKNGIDWNNAYALSSLGTILNQADIAGSTIYIRADEGNYTATSTINLYGGGLPGNRVRIQGVDVNLNPSYAILVGSRKPFTPPPNPETPTNVSTYGGGKLFDVQASNFEMSHLTLINHGLCIAFYTSGVKNVLLENFNVVNAKTFVDNGKSEGDMASQVSNITIRNIVGRGFVKSFIRFRSNSSNILVERVDADSMRQTGDPWASGVVFDTYAHDALVRFCNVRNGFDSSAGYYNGDGYCSENTNYNLRFENNIASGWTDGGHDHKSRNLTILNDYTFSNKRNIRVWSAVTVSYGYNITSLYPKNRGGSGGNSHIYVNGNAKFEIRGGLFIHNTTSTNSCYLGSNATLTLIGVNETFIAPATNPNDHIPSTSKVIRIKLPTLTWYNSGIASVPGAVNGTNCLWVNEPQDGSEWMDNWLCSNENISSWRWSYSGAISGMRCIQWTEPTDTSGWNNNYLCVPTTETRTYKYSNSGAIAGTTCTLITEPKDPKWTTPANNYFCVSV